MTIQCCQCKRVRVQGEWKRPCGTGSETVSHTYGPICLAEVRAEVHRTYHNQPRTAEAMVLAGAPIHGG